MKLKILVVDDEADVRDMVARVLEQNGFEAITAKNGQEALLRDLNDEPDLIVLDIMLPDINGIEVCRRLRGRTTKPVIMLTAKDEEVDRVVGLELGADDYVTKPFSPRELIARVRAQLRRTTEYSQAAEAGEVLDFDEIKIDASRHEVIVRGEEKRLTPKEFDLLHLLARNEGRIMHRDVLMQNVWGYDSSIESRTLDVHIQRLRKKIEGGATPPRLIITVPSLGYKFQAPAKAEEAEEG
ncbi:MAG: response regulator transcription factor, partial [Armatimonadota bacterium]